MADEDFFSRMALDLQAGSGAGSRTTIERIADYARSAVTCDDAGIMRTHARDRLETAAATSRAVAEAHHLQLHLDEGPCLDALTAAEGGEYVSGDVGADARYPAWGPAVAALGFRSVLSVPLRTQERRYGSLNLYSARRDAFDEEDVAVTHIFSRHASVAIASAHEHEGLKVAVDSRKLVGQAQGILMERFDLEADQAFAFLRRHSQDHNIKLREVAEWVVEHRRSHRTPPSDAGREHQPAGNGTVSSDTESG
ncbi:ANTAR domain-containing protein [Georgenia sp. Z1344]|uniref:ANTAR domain-containing protein n=1 Tax=Georgenia sp. Z1344 TaxID=3416706 RepID=UPI003CF9624E